MKNRLIPILALLGLALSFSGCQPVSREIQPTIVYIPSPHLVNSLPSAFPDLNDNELKEEWSKELLIGDAFAHQLDLYQAITAYKRAKILISPTAIERILQIDYDIILCYYLGQKYQEAINTFEDSLLVNANAQFPAFDNLLIILLDCYYETGQTDKVDLLFQTINKCSPETGEDLSLYFDLKNGDLQEAECKIAKRDCPEKFQSHLSVYYEHAKSPQKAKFLNAILPGAGYYYVGQKKSAWTSFFINALFIAAAYQFFDRGYVAAGLITTSLEAGWYLGGINGAGIEAEEFNTRLYEGTVKNMLIENDFFPVLTLQTAF